MYKTFGKRIIDFIVAFIGLLLLFPVLVIVTLLLTIANQGKPFFLQLRPGKNQKLFKIILTVHLKSTSLLEATLKLKLLKDEKSFMTQLLFVITIISLKAVSLDIIK